MKKVELMAERKDDGRVLRFLFSFSSKTMFYAGTLIFVYYFTLASISLAAWRSLIGISDIKWLFFASVLLLGGLLMRSGSKVKILGVLRLVIGAFVTGFSAYKTIMFLRFRYNHFDFILFFLLLFYGLILASSIIMILTSFKSIPDRQKFNKNDELNREFKYFRMLFIVVTLIVNSFMIAVVPTFDTVFQSFGSTLPFLTFCMLKTALFMQKYVYLIFPAEILAVFFILKALKTVKSVKTFKLMNVILTISMGIMICFVIFALFMPVFDICDIRN